MMDTNAGLRDQLSRLLERSQAHIGLDEVAAGIPPETRGIRPAGFAHSAWELVEHIRLAQRDILEFCQEAPYAERAWPDEYWPSTPEPPSATAWDECIAAIRLDCEGLQRIIADPGIDLFATVPNGTDQTYLREVLLVADHNAYHVGQLTAVRRVI
jgi:uncharacterized damage-inducible protein DinB